MKSEIQELKAEKASNENVLAKAKKNKANLNKKLEKLYLKMHKKLIDCQFYSRITYQRDFYRDQPLDKLFHIGTYDLPYRYCGEGDYKCIHFKANGDNLRLNHYTTYGEQNYTICTIPLELFEDGNEDKLQKFIDDLVIKNEAASEAYKEKQKELKRKDLEAQLAKLK